MSDFIIVNTPYNYTASPYNVINNELYHFGIPGMKWGVRRYQNPDGSLTEAGKKHRENLNNASTKAGAAAKNIVNVAVGTNMAISGAKTIGAYKNFADAIGGGSKFFKLLSGKIVKTPLGLMELADFGLTKGKVYKDLALAGLNLLGGVPVAIIGAAAITTAGYMATKKIIEKIKSNNQKLNEVQNHKYYKEAVKGLGLDNKDPKEFTDSEWDKIWEDAENLDLARSNKK